MRGKLVLCLRYVLQVISLVFFTFLLTNLFYPVEWHATILKWFSQIDPWGLLNYLRIQHNIPVWWWLPLLTLIVTLLFGRVFCGWFCPFGALLMLIDKVSRIIFKNRLFKKIKSNRAKVVNKLQPFRYFWLLFLAIVYILGLNWAYSLTPSALFSHEIVRILKGSVPLVLILIIVVTLFFSRLWCSVLCPTGILLSLFSRFRLLRYQVSGTCAHCSKCTNNCSVGAAPEGTGIAKEVCLVCGECRKVCPTKAVILQPIFHGLPNGEKVVDADNIKPNKMDRQTASPDMNNLHTRRQFIKIAGASILAGVIAIGGKTILASKSVLAGKKVLRPPGALVETEFTSVCNRCGRCIKVCPNNALQPMPITDGIECFETPQIIPREASCCLCFSCQEVCPTGAIAKVGLEQVHMGKAVLNKERCLAWEQNKLCLVCVEQCQLRAIESDDQHRPIIQTDMCVGCGSCEKCCAVIGEAAITVVAANDPYL